MATVVSITNPITGAVEQVDKLDHTAQQIDDAVALAPQLSNPNLLDNWYFGNPVNQRNVSGAIDAVGYFLDRWKLVSGSVTIGSNGITLNGTIAQILETAVGTDVTASALTTEGVVVASYDNNSKTISLTGTGQTFVAAKLELGSQQTLAHQDADGNWVLNEIPNYGEQLRRCQRYFCRFNFGRNDLFFGSLTSNLDKAWITIPTPVVMRTAPSVSFSGTFNGVIRGNGFQLEFLTGNSTVAADTSTTRCCNILITPNTKPSAWTAQQVVMIYTSTEWYMDCSADL